MSDNATIEYTNSLGTFKLYRATLSISDTWRWQNGVAKHTKSIGVSGMLERSDTFADTEQYEVITTNATPYMQPQRPALGDGGTLTINSPDEGGSAMSPWQVLSGIRINSISVPVNAWHYYMPIQVQFSDEDPDSNTYEIDFFGMKLHNPSIGVQLPYRGTLDEFVHMPVNKSLQYTTINDYDPAYHPIRQRTTHGNCIITIRGNFLMPDASQPWDVLQDLGTMTQRAGAYGVVSTREPAGYPKTFDMVDISEKVADALPFRKLIVISTDLMVSVERAICNATIVMECLPQRWE